MRPTLLLLDRLLRRCEESDTGCWLWTGGKSQDGYGRLSVDRNGEPFTAYTHRVAYAALVGPIPQGLHIDHLCSVRNCCAPSHLEAVTPTENVLRAAAARRARTAARKAVAA